jgi:ABC-type multidrug transport system ATPase subunit
MENANGFVIQTSDLGKSFKKVQALKSLNLSVRSNSIFGFLGPNGAGKTTTIRMLVGLLRPTSGSMVVAGHEVEKEPLLVKQKVGYLAQTPPLYERLTGREL